MELETILWIIAGIGFLCMVWGINRPKSGIDFYASRSNSGSSEVLNCQRYKTNPYCYSSEDCPETSEIFITRGGGFGTTPEALLKSCRVKRQLDSPAMKAISNEIRKHGSCTVDDVGGIIYTTPDKEDKNE